MKELYQSGDWKSEKHVPIIEAPDRVEKGAFFSMKVSIGKEVANLAKGFGAKVIYYKRNRLDETEEKKSRDVECVCEVVGAVLRVAKNDRDENRECGGLEQCGCKVGAVPQFAEKGPLQLV